MTNGLNILRSRLRAENHFISLRIRLLIGFTLLFTIAFALAYYWFYSYTTKWAMASIESDLRQTLLGTIRGINGDDFEKMVATDQPDASGVPSTDPYYQAHQNWLLTVYNLEPRAFGTYTYIQGPNPNEILWIGDDYRVVRPQTATKYKESYTPGPGSVILQGLTRDTVNMNIYQDQWGEWASAYGPILNSKGQVVGAVGIDFKADYVRQVQQGIVNNIVLAFGVTYLGLFVLVYFASRIFTAPLANLAKAAGHIGEGEYADYSDDLEAISKGYFLDEISLLARDFGAMASKVYQREQMLRHQVEELKIEIDENKRKDQVSEIVETDFFRDLQDKARTMRTKLHPQDPVIDQP